MKSPRGIKPNDHALFIEWGGLTAGSYGRPAICALLLMVLAPIWSMVFIPIFFTLCPNAGLAMKKLDK